MFWHIRIAPYSYYCRVSNYTDSYVYIIAGFQIIQIAMYILLQGSKLCIQIAMYIYYCRVPNYTDSYVYLLLQVSKLCIQICSYYIHLLLQGASSTTLLAYFLINPVMWRFCIKQLLHFRTSSSLFLGQYIIYVHNNVCALLCTYYHKKQVTVIMHYLPWSPSSPWLALTRLVIFSPHSEFKKQVGFLGSMGPFFCTRLRAFFCR